MLNDFPWSFTKGFVVSVRCLCGRENVMESDSEIPLCPQSSEEMKHFRDVPTSGAAQMPQEPAEVLPPNCEI